MIILSDNVSVAYPLFELPQSLIKEMLDQCNRKNHDIFTYFKKILLLVKMEVFICRMKY